MREVPFTVRMPTLLASELKRVSRERGYMDLSEAVRSIIRQRWQREQHPLTFEIERIKEELRLLRPLRPVMQRRPTPSAPAGASAGAGGGGGGE